MGRRGGRGLPLEVAASSWVPGDAGRRDLRGRLSPAVAAAPHPRLQSLCFGFRRARSLFLFSFPFSPSSYFLFFFCTFRFWPCRDACGILVPRPGMEPAPPAVEARGLNHWTTREVPPSSLSAVLRTPPSLSSARFSSPH